MGKSSVGVSAAPTPVNTSSLKSEKEKDTNGLVPVGTNVWVNSSGGTEAANESQTGDSEKPQTRPAPWVSKSQTNEPEGQEGQSSSATSEALKQAKRRSWADSDDDDDDDPPEKPTPPAPYAVPPQAVEQPRQSATSHAPHSTQDVRYFSDRDGRGDQRPTNNRPFARDGAPTGFQQPPDRDFQKNRFESNNVSLLNSQSYVYVYSFEEGALIVENLKAEVLTTDILKVVLKEDEVIHFMETLKIGLKTVVTIQMIGVADLRTDITLMALHRKTFLRSR